MPRTSHAAGRAASRLRRDFPSVPTLPVAGAYDGLAFMLRADDPGPNLRALRDVIVGMAHGPLGEDTRLLVVSFGDTQSLAATVWPGALRLRANGAALQSYHVDATQADALVARAKRITRLELWWAGAAHRIALDMLTPVPLASLWDLPDVVLHASHPIAVARPTAPGRIVEQAELALVSRASVPIVDARSSGNALAQRLRELPERDRVAVMAAKLRHRIATGSRRRLGGSAAGPARVGTPGPLSAMLGWLRWHTPLGEGLKRQFGERVTLVDKLIAQGDIDRALQLALKLGDGGRGSGKLPTRYPNQLPKERASLDLDTVLAPCAAPIFAEASFHHIRDQYLGLARTLEARGDWDRAAFIHSQLLGDHREAALLLERGERFADAARLALDARLDPVLTIRLLYRSDQLDAALALARRAGCFEALAADSEKREDEYHAYVMRAWTDLLIATGQPLRAIHVTETLAAREVEDGPLGKHRRTWLAAALQQAGDAADGELTARVLLSARWDGTDLDARGMEAFPYRPAARGPEQFDNVLDRLQAAARGEGEDADQLLLATLTALARLGEPRSPEQAPFWQLLAPVLVEGFARALIAVAASRLLARDFDQLEVLLRKARLPVFAEDLGKLRKLHRPALPPGDGRWRIPPATSHQAAVRHACPITNGTILIWREDGRLHLLDRNGRPLWQGEVGEVVGLVPIGTSPTVLLIQREGDGKRLSRFSSDTRRFDPIGKVDLRAHHHRTSESQWLVQIGGEIGALDLVKLCARTATIEFVWSCSLTDRLRAIAFAHQPGGASWITCDTSPERLGILERWTLEAGGTLTTSIGLPALTADKVPVPTHWFWDAKRHRLGSIEPKSRWMILLNWTEQAEDEVRDLHDQRRAAKISGYDTVQSCDSGEPFVRWTQHPDGSGEVVIGRVEAVSASGFSLVHDPDTRLSCLCRSGNDVDGAVQLLFADEAGRLFLVDPEPRRVTLL